MKSIDLIVYAGLCNRLRAIASGLQLAKKLNIPITIYWNRTKDCNCNFNDLFDIAYIPIKGFKIIENKSIIHKISEKKNLFFPRLLQTFVYDQIFYDFCWWPNNDIFPLLKFKNKILFQNCQSICKYDEMNPWLIPNQRLQKQINAITDLFSDKTIGLHIRGTDHKVAKQNSTLDKFINYIDNEINKESNTKFFLASDEISIKNQLEQIYKDRIITNNIELTRSSKKGMEGAVIDLFCLSKTKFIYGSMNSTYSMTAAEMGKIKLIVVK